MKIIRIITKISILSFILNLIWENIQSPLYHWFVDFFTHFNACLSATIWDVFIILGIYFLLVLIFRDFNWINTIWKKEAFFILILWFIVAFVFEKHAIITWRWQYNELMPIIPLLWVWLSPILQMMIIPYFTFWLVWKSEKNKKVKETF